MELISMYELNVDQWHRDHVMIMNDVGFSCEEENVLFCFYCSDG